MWRLNGIEPENREAEQLRAPSKLCALCALAILCLTGLLLAPASEGHPPPEIHDATRIGSHDQGDHVHLAEFSETEVQIIPLSGPASSPDAEVSGLAWCGDVLLMLPQHPDRLSGDQTPGFYYLPRTEILRYIDGERKRTLTPLRLPCAELALLDEIIEGYDGLEAVTVVDDRLFLTIEAWSADKMIGYLVQGRVLPDLAGVTLDLHKVAPIDRSLNLSNMTDETIVYVDDQLLTLHEANGANVQHIPRARIYDLDLNALGSLPSPTLEYRITDATAVDTAGRFWVINYYYPPDVGKLKPAVDQIVREFGVGPTHRRALGVERLIEFRYLEKEIVRTDTPPVMLELMPIGSLRNWEGLARLADEQGERGFLIMTDRYPETLLGFVPLP